ncbi:MAG: hypothetical protein CM15mP23_06980 [Cryomorphaceae bacterium]|nr:MAG: hypothetical protein CM15mP23_06980 [Cryomorphaceae bacterium]
MVEGSFTVNSQSIVSLPAPEYPITLMDYPGVHEFKFKVYIRITDENGELNKILGKFFKKIP